VVDAHDGCSPVHSSRLKEMGTNHDTTPFSLPNDGVALLNKQLKDQTAHTTHMFRGDDASTSEGGNGRSY
jgi:hypothetical protein